MADQSIGSLPSAPDLYDDSLLVVEQQGEAMHIKGLQIRGFAEQGVQRYVESAQTAANTAMDAVSKVGTAVEDAQSAAQTAQKYSGKPPVIQDGTWWTWDAETQGYKDTGKPARGEQGEQGKPGSSIEKIERTAGDGAPGSTDTYTITLTDGATSDFQVYNGKDGEGSGVGDMLKIIYDPQNKKQDIFAYVDKHVPKDIATMPDSAKMVPPAELGSGPYTIEFTAEDGAEGGSAAITPESIGAAKAVHAEQHAYSGSDPIKLSVPQVIVNSNMHNTMYNPINLGTSITDEQLNEIKTCDYKALYLGAFWEINGVRWQIVHFNYPLHHTGQRYYNNIAIMPIQSLYQAQMNASDPADRDYLYSDLKATGLSEAEQIIDETFGSLVIPYYLDVPNKYLDTEVIGSIDSANTSLIKSKVDIPNSIMMFGYPAVSRTTNKDTFSVQLSLLKMDPNCLMSPLINSDRPGVTFWGEMWLRDYAENLGSAVIDSHGGLRIRSATKSNMVRPIFFIGGEEIE